jgi:hypothetical protein
MRRWQPYVCGSQLFPAGHKLDEAVCCNHSLTCSSLVESNLCRVNSSTLIKLADSFAVSICSSCAIEHLAPKRSEQLGCNQTLQTFARQPQCSVRSDKGLVPPQKKGRGTPAAAKRKVVGVKRKRKASSGWGGARRSAGRGGLVQAWADKCASALRRWLTSLHQMSRKTRTQAPTPRKSSRRLDFLMRTSATVMVRASSSLTLRVRRRRPTTAAAAEMKVTVTAQTAVATLRRLQLQLQRQVMPVQAHLHVKCVRTAAAATSEQLQVVATGSAVHAILQHVVILFPALRGCGDACTLRLSCAQRCSCIWSLYSDLAFCAHICAQNAK